jgi:predicted DNA-binding transcriptional regulator AlpA
MFTTTDEDVRPNEGSASPYLRYSELRSEGVPYSRTHLAALEAKGLFPKRIRLTTNVICWDRREVREWLARRRGARE